MKPTIDWKKYGSLVSDPYEGGDSEKWHAVLKDALETNPLLYVKLAGLRCGGAELVADSKFKYRLVMANDLVPHNAVQELLKPHAQELIEILRRI